MLTGLTHAWLFAAQLAGAPPLLIRYVLNVAYVPALAFMPHATIGPSVALPGAMASDGMSLQVS